MYTKIKSIFIILLVLSTLVSCDNCKDYPNNSILKILCLGDSRVSGNPPSNYSYRYPLWKIFIEHNIYVDFLGNKSETYQYPKYNGFCFDSDHNAYPGITSSNLVQIVNNMNLDETPDIIYISIGGNDLLKVENDIPTIINNIKIITDKLTKLYPKSLIYIDKLAPGRSTSFSKPEFNKLSNLNNSISEFINSSSSKYLGVIDLTNNWNDKYLSDNIHYSELGAEHVANIYYKELKKIKLNKIF